MHDSFSLFFGTITPVKLNTFGYIKQSGVNIRYYQIKIRALRYSSVVLAASKPVFLTLFV